MEMVIVSFGTWLIGGGLVFYLSRRFYRKSMRLVYSEGFQAGRNGTETFIGAWLRSEARTTR